MIRNVHICHVTRSYTADSGLNIGWRLYTELNVKCIVLMESENGEYSRLNRILAIVIVLLLIRDVDSDKAQNECSTYCGCFKMGPHSCHLCFLVDNYLALCIVLCIVIIWSQTSMKCSCLTPSNAKNHYDNLPQTPHHCTRRLLLIPSVQ